MKRLLGIFFVFSCILHPLFPEISSDVLTKYPNPFFVETGNYLGHGVKQALKAQFRNLYSIEQTPHHFTYTKQIFEKNENVHLFLGGSFEKLVEVLSNVRQPATFWLNSFSRPAFEGKVQQKNNILKELAVIRSHYIKTHTILIDRANSFGTPPYESVTLKQIITAIREINPKYQFSFERGDLPDDILVAKVHR